MTKDVDPTISTLPNFNPSGDINIQYIKDQTEDLLKYIQVNVPNNRRRATALTNYEQAAMWAVKACIVEKKELDPK